MGPIRLLHLSLTLLAFSAPFTVASAQDASVSDPPNEMISEGQPLRDNVLLFPLYGQLASNQVDGLLLFLKLWSRQQEVTCATNYTACQGSQFCCPDGNSCCSGGTCCGAGTYCTTIAGVEGCCQNDHVCSQVTDQCTVAGQQRCPNDNFCCDTGDTCYRDASNNPRCSSPNNSSISSSVSIHSSTASSILPTASHSDTASASAALRSVCQLKPQGALSRRHASPHPAPRRRRWFW